MFQRLKNIVRAESLAFIGFAALIWVVMTVSSAAKKEIARVELRAETSLIQGRFLQDTVASVMIDVEASGISALRLGQFQESSLVVPIEFFETQEGGLQVPIEKVLELLSDTYGSDYTFGSSLDYINFPAEFLQKRLVPIQLIGENNISVPFGKRWSEPLHLEPQFVEVEGPEQVLNTAEVSALLPDFEWDGSHALNLELQCSERSVRMLTTSVDLVGTTEDWAEERYVVERIIGQRINRIDVWVSGPAARLRKAAIEDVCEVRFRDGGDIEWVEVEPRGSLISVLEVVPSSLEK